jgi:hypothetical protein
LKRKTPREERRKSEKRTQKERRKNEKRTKRRTKIRNYAEIFLAYANFRRIFVKIRVQRPEKGETLCADSPRARVTFGNKQA